MKQIPANVPMPRPPYRRLKAFAYDPVVSQSIETHEINEVTIKLPWQDKLGPGPSDDCLQVVDVDPGSQAFYAPVNLNEPDLLAQDGLPPSERRPQFHQQMVYAVARTTIRHFELALGRCALWSPRRFKVDGKWQQEYVEHLRIYPHALRQPNAYYNSAKKALLFGYFPAVAADVGENLPGGTVFTCLSHDIVAHETTHALLDGLHPRFMEPTNVDVWAFHEAFADIVALFQHFTYPDALRHQIARTRGDLSSENLLGELAYQFGQATGCYGAMRSAIGRKDPETGKWIPEVPDPQRLRDTTEPHARGAILVAAVFDAFLTIYRARTADLVRIATGGASNLPPGALHPDLVERLAQEAAKAAGHVLHMCIRALDYSVVVDPSFGDYLRALVTADADLVKDDRFDYRLAMIDAFRRRGIYPTGVRSLSEENLLWNEPDARQQEAFRQVFGKPAHLRRLVPDWELTSNRRKIYEQTQKSRAMLHEWFMAPKARAAADAANLVLDPKAPEAFYRGQKDVPKLEVHSVRPAHRIGPDGQTVTDVVIEMTQRRRGYYDEVLQEKVDRGMADPPPPDFIFRGGCTLLVDPDTAKVRYCVYKRIRSESRLKSIRDYLTGESDSSPRAAYFDDSRTAFFNSVVALDEIGQAGTGPEPFALLHRSFVPEEME